MAENKAEIPYVYIYIYSKLKKEARFSPLVGTKFVLSILKKVVRVPKSLDYPILKQMERHGLIKRMNHQKYRILSSNCEKKLERLRDYTFW